MQYVNSKVHVLQTRIEASEVHFIISADIPSVVLPTDSTVQLKCSSLQNSTLTSRTCLIAVEGVPMQHLHPEPASQRLLREASSRNLRIAGRRRCRCRSSVRPRGGIDSRAGQPSWRTYAQKCTFSRTNVCMVFLTAMCGQCMGVFLQSSLTKWPKLKFSFVEKADKILNLSTLPPAKYAS